MPAQADLRVANLGPAAVISPLAVMGATFVEETDRVLLASTIGRLPQGLSGRDEIPAFEPAGPRAHIYFDPRQTICGIVSCGGLCPGLNDVVRALVLTLFHQYGVKRVLGFRYGYAGLGEQPPAPPLELDPAVVHGIHNEPGTILGSSRGPQDPDVMVDTLIRHGVSILFALGGDGTLKGASAIARAALRRHTPISVIGIPKTIDNDIEWVVRSFGFTTAVEEAHKVLRGAHAEASGGWNGVGLVKLMGRDSGFIAANATLSSSDVNFCLVPEVPFELEGPDGFLMALERRLDQRHHAVVAVAEGAGRNILKETGSAARDESGNLRYPDIGVFIRDRIKRYFSEQKKSVDVKYIDPSYAIRSVPANALDSELCLTLGQQAAHAGMAGRTDMVVGYWNQCYTHVPIAVATSRRKQIDPGGTIWQRVLETTGQPALRAEKELVHA